MSSIDHKELFEQYYQKAYDFSTASLSFNEVDEIKKLVREKRVDYALAPMGTGVFSWIQKQDNNIRFELVPFDSEKIDGMLYIPTTGNERGYIILNAKKPLINQIFTAAHEFYHYIKDYRRFREKPYVCDFSMLKDVNEKRACRFAAELLLPEEALLREVRDYCRIMGISLDKIRELYHFAAISILLTVRYQMPLKAVFYRLAEENYVDCIDSYIETYDFIKKVLQEIKIFENLVNELYHNKNDYIMPYNSTYQDMEKAFLSGNASKETILEDAKKLNLDMNLINDFLSDPSDEDGEGNDEELFSLIRSKWR